MELGSFTTVDANRGVSYSNSILSNNINEQQTTTSYPYSHSKIRTFVEKFCSFYFIVKASFILLCITNVINCI